ncbi:uncharacterized protein LOC116208541 [Punica granatum]|uniref:Uncharacterized protein LOC116208541 n=2 Tax=Punica granatum TaxID=22663 RepID=A0A6P8DKL9_PUNGR|nr:uncharacterized protein LOC116208541 [Punica granatum]
MVSLETIQSTSRSIDPANATPRISFSADPNENNSAATTFISISPKLGALGNRNKARSERPDLEKSDFEFLSANPSLDSNILTADELFSEGKLLPFWQAHHSENRPTGMATLRTRPGPDGEEDDEPEEGQGEARDGEGRAAGTPADKDAPGRGGPGWFMDDDPSPRPPKCTVLWKELLRLRNRPLPPDTASPNSEKKEGASGGAGERDKDANKRAKKGLERTRSGTLRIRPMINVPICSTVKGTSNYVLPPPLFPTKKGRVER